MDPKFVEMAKNELREEPARKSQALEQFREFITKHPFILSSRRDDTFLLSFLRITKFNVDQACQRYEKYYILTRKYPAYLDYNHEELDKIVELYDQGFVYPLPGRDEEGRKILVVRVGRRDSDKFSSSVTFKTVMYVILVLLEDHANQISGFSMIFDYSDVTMKHIFTPMDLKVMIEGVKTGMSVRQKKYYIINTSTIVTKMIEIMMMLMSDKMKSRLEVLKETSELVSKFKCVEMLPKELGGKVPEAEIISEFRKELIEKQNVFIESMKYEIDWTKVPKHKLEEDEYENVGSFRKLEID